MLIFLRRSFFFFIFTEEFKPPPITLDILRKEKAYKAGKKQTKEMETMKKKHLKEKQTMQKNHCVAMEKLSKGKEYKTHTQLLSV